MPSELTPGQLAETFSRISAQVTARSRLVLEPLALAIENQAKVNVSSGAHPFGTRSPARPGSGPAIVTGTLRRAITHTPPAPTGGGWSATVGIAGGIYPPRRPGAGKRGGRSNPTPASKYGSFLENGVRNGSRFPFLVPAFHFGVTIAAPTIYRSVFSAPWGTTAA